jgi:predicted alpha/beta superfamily hydrolase
MRSKILGTTIQLHLRLPADYKTAKKRYPVLYCLHANQKALEEIASLAQKNSQEKNCPELIIVGVDEIGAHIDRMGNNPEYDRFLTFMDSELMPAIAKQYRSNGQSVLYERSLSGSFGLYTLLTNPKLFKGYIAASKQWYELNNDYFTVLATIALVAPGPYKGKRIFLATLNGAYNNNNIPVVDEQMQAFSNQLGTLSKGLIASKYQAFDDWGISPQPGFAEGLKFVFQTDKSSKSKALSMVQNPNGKWIIQNQQKEELYEVFMFDNGPDYASEGLIRIVKNGKIGYADAKTFVQVVVPQFDCAFPFENGKAKVSKDCKTVKDGEHSSWTSEHWQFIDKKGKF